MNVQVFAAGNCASGDHIVDMSIIVNGSPGGTGSFTLNTTLGGSGVPYLYNYSVPDALLGVAIDSFGNPGGNTWFNGTGWTTLNGTAVITVTADGVGPATLTVDCITRAVSIANYQASGTVPDTYQGPGIPSGFVLRTITCNTAIFNAPSGQAVGNNQVTVGQNWYVNPTPSDPDANGRRWTEIFVSGFQNGYIPAECVGGQETLRPSPVTRSAAGDANSAGGTGGTVSAGAGIGIAGGANGQTTVNTAGQTVYTVALGDRLYRIALRFGIPWPSLAAANGITSPNLIYPGQQLIIPR